MALNIEGAYAWPEDLANYYREKKWWLGLTWGDILDRSADQYGPRVALIDDEVSLTWDQFREKVDRLAWALLEMGIKKNDTIVVQVKNSHEYLICFMAICRIGAIELQALTNHGEREISHFITMTDAAAWIVSLDDKAKDMRPLVNTIKPKYPRVRKVICIGNNIPDGCEDFDKIIAEANPPKNRDFWTAIRPDPNHVYLIGLTGGTTGLSKGVPRTYNDHVLCAYGYCKAQQLTSNDVGLILTPVAHNLAHVCLMLPMLLEGGTIVIANMPNPDRTMEIIQNTKATFLWSVPTQLSRMLDSPSFDKYDLSSLRFIASGGALVLAELVRGVKKEIGCDFVIGFGMIEGPCTCTRFWDPSETKFDTIGTSCAPYDEFKVIDPTTEAELPRGQEGELVSKGPGVFQGYFKTSRENLYTNDGFFRSGDLAKMDEEGRISITGRIKDVINRGGEMISAREIEEIMMTHVRVGEAAVIAMPCRDLGERVCLYVRPKEGAADLSLEEVQKHCEATGLAKFQWPERVENLSELPLTNVGKADKKRMRDMIGDILKKEGKI